VNVCNLLVHGREFYNVLPTIDTSTDNRYFAASCSIKLLGTGRSASRPEQISDYGHEESGSLERFRTTLRDRWRRIWKTLQSFVSEAARIPVFGSVVEYARRGIAGSKFCTHTVTIKHLW